MHPCTAQHGGLAGDPPQAYLICCLNVDVDKVIDELVIDALVVLGMRV